MTEPARHPDQCNELGWTNLVTSSWQGVLVPSGTPRPIIEKLHAAIVKVLADPAIQARMRNVGAIAVASTSPEEFKAYMDSETAKWNKVIQDSGVRAGLSANVAPDAAQRVALAKRCAAEPGPSCLR